MHIEAINGVYQTSCWKLQKVSGVSVLVSALPPAKQTTGQIEKETLKKRISIFCGSAGFRSCL